MGPDTLEVFLCGDAMKTDALFYRLFQTLPEVVFELAGLDEPDGRRYHFRSEEVKQTAFRLDGVLEPPETNPGGPVVCSSRSRCRRGRRRNWRARSRRNWKSGESGCWRRRRWRRCSPRGEAGLGLGGRDCPEPDDFGSSRAARGRAFGRRRSPGSGLLRYARAPEVHAAISRRLISLQTGRRQFEAIRPA